MDNNERDRKLDQWLDEALSQYSAAEPRLGLEQRVLSNVRAEQQARAGRRTWWRWMPAFAAVAAVLIVMVAVRPYWEQKSASKETLQPRSASGEHANSDAVAGYTKTQPSVAEKESVPAEIVSTRGKQTAAEDRVQEKDARLYPSRSAPLPTKLENQPSAAPASRSSNSFEIAGAPAKKADKDLVLLNTRRDVLVHANDQPVLVAVPAPPPPRPPVAAGVVAGNVTTAVPAQNERSEYPSAATLIQVAPASEAVDIENTQLATEKIATLPEVSAKQMKAMKAKAKANSPLAKKLEENVDTVSVPGMATLRTNLKSIPPGPGQQFPTPLPLSEQEKLMMAAAKQLKNKPANERKQDVSDGDIKAIEIKKIEIAPLPGPPK